MDLVPVLYSLCWSFVGAPPMAEPAIEDRSLSLWVTQLRSAEKEERDTAVRALLVLGEDALPALPRLQALLRDELAGVRQSAVEAVAGLGPAAKDTVPILLELIRRPRPPLEAMGYTFAAIGPEAERSLVAALKQNEAIVRAGAAHALRYFLTSRMQLVPELEESLRREADPTVRVQMFGTLAVLRLPEKSLPNYVQEALGDKEKLVRDAAAAFAAAWAERQEDLAKSLESLLAERDNPRRQFAARILAHPSYRSTRSPIGPLTRALDDPMPEVRRLASAALARWWADAKPSVAALQQRLDDADPTVRIYALVALHRIENKLDGAGPIVRAAYKENEVETRRAAIRLLQSASGKIADAEIMLIAALQDGDSLIRQIAAQTLGQFRPLHAAGVTGLAGLLPDRDPQVRIEAVTTLVGVRGLARPILQEVVDAASDWQEVVRLRARQILTAHVKEALPLVLARATDKDASIRERMIGTLATLGEAAQVQATLLKAQDDEALEVRLTATAALATRHLSGKAPLPIFVLAFKDRDVQRRRQAAQLLTEFGRVPSAHTLLETALRDEDVEVRRLAALAVRQWSDNSQLALAVLSRALEDRERIVRRTAAQTLAAFGKVTMPIREAILSALRHDDPVATASLLAVLSDGKEDVTLVLLNGLQNESALVRAGAARQLGRLDLAFATEKETAELRERIVQQLIKAIEKEKGVPAQALVASLRVWSRAQPKARSVLEKLAHNVDPLVRRTAALALLDLNSKNEKMASGLIEVLRRGPTTATGASDFDRALLALQNLKPTGKGDITALVSLLDEPRMPVRRAGANVLAASGPAAKDTVPTLLRHLQDEKHKEVKQALAEALRQIDRNSIKPPSNR